MEARAVGKQPASDFRSLPLLRRFPRPARQEERQRQADPGQHDAGQEGGLEALRQADERVRARVGR